MDNQDLMNQQNDLIDKLLSDLPNEEATPAGEATQLTLQTAIALVLSKLDSRATEVETGTRWYLAGPYHSEARFHTISMEWQGVQIDQTNVDDKYKQGVRVNFEEEEIPGLIKILLTAYAKNILEKDASKGKNSSEDIDDNPF